MRRSAGRLRLREFRQHRWRGNRHGTVPRSPITMTGYNKPSTQRGTVITRFAIPETVMSQTVAPKPARQDQSRQDRSSAPSSNVRRRRRGKLLQVRPPGRSAARAYRASSHPGQCRAGSAACLLATIQQFASPTPSIPSIIFGHISAPWTAPPSSATDAPVTPWRDARNRFAKQRSVWAIRPLGWFHANP